MTEADALRLEIEALHRQRERELVEVFQAGRAYERRRMAQARHRAMTQPRQHGGLTLVGGPDFDQSPPSDDFDQTPHRGEEAA